MWKFNIKGSIRIGKKLVKVEGKNGLVIKEKEIAEELSKLLGVPMDVAKVDKKHEPKVIAQDLEAAQELADAPEEDCGCGKPKKDGDCDCDEESEKAPAEEPKLSPQQKAAITKKKKAEAAKKAAEELAAAESSDEDDAEAAAEAEELFGSEAEA